jgi:hypothetical protein
MRHPRYVAALCAILILSVATACSSSSEPTPSGISVSLTFNRTSLRTSDTLLIEVLGTNTSAETIGVQNDPCLANLDARNERDEPVDLGEPRYCTAPLYPPTLVAPGDSWGDTVRLIHPPLGEYRVRGKLPSPIGYVYSDFTSVTVRP